VGTRWANHIRWSWRVVFNSFDWLTLLAGLVIFPPVTNLLKEKANFEISNAVKVLSFFILLGISMVATGGSKSNQATNIPSPSAAPVVNATLPPSPASTESCKGVLFGKCFDNCSTPTPTKLNASVKVNSQYLIVTNNDDVEWSGCDYSIGADINPDDFYELGIFGNYSTIKPHQTEYIPWGAITKTDGTRFNYGTTEPSDLQINCAANNNKGGTWSNY
jgi:hypothetical protein